MELAGGFFAGVGRSCSRVGPSVAKSFTCSVAPSSSAAGSASSKAGQSLNSGAAPNRRVAWSRAKGGLVAKSFTCSASPSSSAAGSPLLAIDTSSNGGSSLNSGAAPNRRVACSREKVVVIREKPAELYESEQQWSKAAQMLSGIDLDSGIRMLDDTNKLSKCVQIARLYLELVVIREKLAELYESEQQWSKAAQMLSGIDLDSGIRMLDDTNKLSKCVQIARLYLEDDDAVNAEAFINKASFLVTNSHQEVLNLQYKVCYARILDLKRRFLEAALQYYDISQIEQRKIGDEEIDENALEQVLIAAVTCTILAGADPQRSHVLAILYKDERCSKLKIYPILQKVYLERILRKPEIDAFAEEMRPHPKALLPDKSIVLDRAMIEHYCLSASKLYTNIREIDRNALERALSAAVTCAVLSGAGPQHPHLATLYKDERCSKLKIYPILQKIYLERILRKQEIDAFAEELRPHQKALLPDKSTVPDGAMIKHNLLSASKLYTNISFDEAGTWLGIHPRKAEKIASQMIYDDRMQGSIDQVEAVIHFDDDTEELQQWDQQIATGHLCTGAASCVAGVAPSRVARPKGTSVVKFASEVRAARYGFFGPAAGSCRGKTRISDKRCQVTSASASASASAPALDWENVA